MPETSVLPKAHCWSGFETCEPHNLIWTIEPCSAKGVNWSARTWVFAAEAIGLNLFPRYPSFGVRATACCRLQSSCFGFCSARTFGTKYGGLPPGAASSFACQRSCCRRCHDRADNPLLHVSYAVSISQLATQPPVREEETGPLTLVDATTEGGVSPESDALDLFMKQRIFVSDAVMRTLVGARYHCGMVS